MISIPLMRLCFSTNSRCWGAAEIFGSSSVPVDVCLITNRDWRYILHGEFSKSCDYSRRKQNYSTG